MTLQTAPTGSFPAGRHRRFRRHAAAAPRLRSAAAGSHGDDLRLPGGVARRRRSRVEGRCATRAFAWFLGGNDLSIAAGRSAKPAAAATDCIPTAPTKTAAASRWSPICSALPRFASLRALSGSHAKPAPLRAVARLSSFTLQLTEAHLVTSHVPEPAGALSASRSRARDRAPVQAGDRTARSQPDRQDPRQPYRRPRSGARCRGRGQPAGRRAGEFPGPPSQSAGDLRGARRRDGGGARGSRALHPGSSAS